eukprot:TRINITY_DN47368_c0_g1_i1.p1 TRINITY_DN47368_c0_g1~~TRINITY_DN47368_c0_g1_i1.p1  ORF type:complete len:325 (-),score=50.60 TRINITY_DN47368_c0_g1_i1:101-1075(-)
MGNHCNCPSQTHAEALTVNVYPHRDDDLVDLGPVHFRSLSTLLHTEHMQAPKTTSSLVGREPSQEDAPTPLDMEAKFLHSLCLCCQDNVPNSDEVESIRQHFAHAQEGKDLTAGKTVVRASLYYMRPGVSFEGKRAVPTKGVSLTMGQRLMADAVGKYHVGIEFRGREFTYGMHHGFHATDLIGDVSSHQPARAGPRMELKTQLVLGESEASLAEVTAWACLLGQRSFAKGRYNLVAHNCQTFANSLLDLLDCESLPDWVTVGSRIAKSMGCAGMEEKEDTDIIVVADECCSQSTAASRCSSFSFTNEEDLTWSMVYGQIEREA